MKNKIFRFMLVFGITMLLSSCLGLLFSKTHELTVDPNNPADQNATITFVSKSEKGQIIVKTWNDVDISENLYGKKWHWSDDKTKLTVPAGKNTFFIDINFQKLGKTVNYQQTYVYLLNQNVDLQYNLEAGKKYEVKGRVDSSGILIFKKYEFFVGIYDTTNKSTLLKEWKLAEYK